MDKHLDSVQAEETSKLARIGYQAGVDWAQRQDEEVVARVASMDPGDYTHEGDAYSLAERLTQEALGDWFSREMAVDFWEVACPNDDGTMPDDDVVQGFIQGAQAVHTGVSQASAPDLDRKVGLRIAILVSADASLDLNKVTELVQTKLSRMRWPTGVTAKSKIEVAAAENCVAFDDLFPASTWTTPQSQPKLRLVG